MAFLRSQRRLARTFVDFASRTACPGSRSCAHLYASVILANDVSPTPVAAPRVFTSQRVSLCRSPFLPPSKLCRVQVAKGALAALEALAGDNTGGSTIQAPLNSTGGGGRHRKAADTARALLILPCVESSPVDLVMCYARCRVAPGVGEGEAVGATEVGGVHGVECCVLFRYSHRPTMSLHITGWRSAVWNSCLFSISCFIEYFNVGDTTIPAG